MQHLYQYDPYVMIASAIIAAVGGFFGHAFWVMFGN